MKQALKSFNTGFIYIFKGWKTVKTNRDVFLLSLVPMLINITLFIYLFSAGIQFGGGLIQSAIGYYIGDVQTGFWIGALSFVLSAILFVGLFVLLIYFIYIIGSVIASPFLSLIAERIFSKRGLLKEEKFKLKSWLSFTLRMLMVSLLKSFVLLGLGLLLFIVSFIPGLNVFSSYLTCVIMAFDTMDYAFELDQLNLRQRFQFLRHNSIYFSGMGLIVSLTVIVPGLTLLALPIMVAGATETYIELRGQNDSRSGTLTNL